MKTILIVDDDELNQELYAGLAKSWGYQVIISDDGRDALDKYKELSPDLLITDIYMRNNGIELMTKVKDIDPELPIITISGGIGIDDGEEVLLLSEQMGAVYSMKKPVEADKLEAIVRSILD
jgi:DNA-binding NtrC family response regulator